MSVIEKLKYVHLHAPILLQPRIARVIEAVGRNEPRGVKAPITQKPKILETPIDLLQENADSFLALMRTLPKKHKFKKLIGEITGDAESLKTKFEETGQALAKLLESDEEELPGIKSSALGELAGMIEREGTKLSDLIELTKILNTLAGKVHKEEKTEPVEHDLPGKEVKPGEESADEQMGGPLAEEPLPENPGGSSPMSQPGSAGGMNELFST